MNCTKRVKGVNANLSTELFHRGGVQRAAGPDGGEAESDEASGEHLQEDRQPHPGWTY